MKIVLDGIRVMRGYDCDYFDGVPMFTKRGLNRSNVLHELYHHLVEVKGIEMSERKEERLLVHLLERLRRKNKGRRRQRGYLRIQEASSVKVITSCK